MQWRLGFGATQRAVGFLCEGGGGSKPLEQRFWAAVGRLDAACEALGIPRPRWLSEVVFPCALPGERAWPATWRSALRFNVEVSAEGVRLAPCLNLNWGAPAGRWGRVVSILKSLGRAKVVPLVDELAARAPAGTWPAGLAIDILPGGAAGDFKVYFQSALERVDWLQRWYLAAGATQDSAAVRRLLDAFPWPGRNPYPEGAFVVGVELPRDGPLRLETDLAVSALGRDDVSILRGARNLLGSLELDTREPLTVLERIGAWPPPEGEKGHLRHVGLGHEPGGGPRVLLSLAPLGAAPSMRRPPVPLRSTRAALRDGLSFLFYMRDGGHWADFFLPAGEVDRWVTAYILLRLSRLPLALFEPKERRQLEESVDWLLAARNPSGGWGYNRSSGDDADSTSLAILALRRHGRPVPREARDVLRCCLGGDGGVATYPRQTPLGGSWAASVPDVTALALAALGDELDGARRREAERFLESRRLPGGLWPSFWWLTPLYATWAVLEARVAGKKSRRSTEIEAQLLRALRKYMPVNTFEVALLLLCQEYLGVTPPPGGLAQRLQSEQQPDGSWLPSAYLRLPSPRVTEPWSTIDAGPAFVDRRGLLTTATALEALALLPQSVAAEVPALEWLELPA